MLAEARSSSHCVIGWKSSEQLGRFSARRFQIPQPDISSDCKALPDRGPSIFLKRHLKKIRDLGEGHFGKVMLYMSDPANDGTGEYVAVKTVKQEEGSLLHESWMKEIEILKSLYHNNTVKYKGCCTELGEFFSSPPLPSSHQMDCTRHMMPFAISLFEKYR
ncbi:hypothetical protein AMELA_G00285370 [Ameiurus melas]|uniref:Protein kinase domain-containing protein n=1 Tax=Ameiurus melas TaxID=219545 RepID=A0A7J5ZID7_AMEME|nr:hypothetical protein AMELA_G00285370 [Ameiurus melas]